MRSISKILQKIEPFRDKSLPSQVKIVEVSLRDGLQNEKVKAPIELKLEMLEKLSSTGLKAIETPIVNDPKQIKSMYQHMKPDIQYFVNTRTAKDFARHWEEGWKYITLHIGTTKEYTFDMTNTAIDHSIELSRIISADAYNASVKIRGYVDCVMGCPIVGDVPIEDVRYVVKSLFNVGCAEMSLWDNVGYGTPSMTEHLLHNISADIPPSQLSVHFHDTFGNALENILTAMQAGVTIVDTSVAGLGKWKYSNNGPGNIATEDVVYALHELGVETGVDLEALSEVGNWFC